MLGLAYDVGRPNSWGPVFCRRAAAERVSSLLAWPGPICGIQFLVPPRLLLNLLTSVVGDIYHKCTPNLPTVLVQVRYTQSLTSQ